MSPTRRDFLKQVSAATALGAVTPFPLRMLSSAKPGDVIAEVDEALLRELAQVAVETARHAGAGFSDVRLSAVRSFGFSASFNRSRQQRPSMGAPTVTFPTDYGVRALVDGAWGFAGGTVLKPEAVAQVAQRAVSRARANRPRRPRELELAPVPRVEDGRWATPIEQDPFQVRVGDQGDLALSSLMAAEGVRGVIRGFVQMGWSQTLHVFASSDGSLIVQRLSSAGPSATAYGRSRDDHEINGESAAGLRSGGYGYEAMSHAGLDLVAEMRRAAERAVASSRPPGPEPVSVEVGRYDLVLGGNAMISVMLNTLAPALNLERALGYLANGVGTSFAAPPSEILDQYEVASSLITVRADRTSAHANATVGWDDEGVPAGEHTLIRDGVIVDYLTSRQSAAELAASYRGRGEPVRSRGCTVGRGQSRPQVSTPNLTLEPGPEEVSAEDLIADTKRGFYVPGAFGVSDQQLLSGQFGGGGVREIRDGELGRPMKDFAFQFMTPQFWKSLDAIGGPTSVVEQVLQTLNARAVPARARGVNVLNTGITL